MNINNYFINLLVHKRIILMRLNLIVFFILMAFIQVNAKSYAQNVTLSVKDKSMEEVFQLIKEQTGYVFFYNNKNLGKEKVSIDVANSSIDETLEECFGDRPFTYKILNRNILIKEEEGKSTATSKRARKTQYREVTGVVTDRNGEVLPGVSVKLKGTIIQTSTNSQGAYSIQVPEDDNATLEFSFIGFSTQEVVVNNQQTLNVALAESVSNLDEIVV